MFEFIHHPEYGCRDLKELSSHQIEAIFALIVEVTNYVTHEVTNI
jgi:hypothetical protein